MPPSLVYLCVQEIPNTIFVPGHQILIYKDQIDGDLHNIMKRKVNHFTLVLDNTKKQ